MVRGASWLSIGACWCSCPCSIYAHCTGTGVHVTDHELTRALLAEGLPRALQDAVAGTIEDGAVIPMARVKDLLVDAGVGLAAAKRVVGRLVRPVQVWDVGD
jgi:hypothetical protein